MPVPEWICYDRIEDRETIEVLVHRRLFTSATSHRIVFLNIRTENLPDSSTQDCSTDDFTDIKANV